MLCIPLYFRYTTTSVLRPYLYMASEHVWHILHSVSTWALFNRCFCCILHYFTPVSVLPYTC